jgi:ABC-2 type transport system ATP-binding protein
MAIISVSGLTKTYASGHQALKTVDLDIRKGEIFALLGPNGAGKTTLISIICGIVNPSTGTVSADGHDVVKDYRAARTKIGLVPQELSTDAFETVWATTRFSRGLFGKAPQRRLYREGAARPVAVGQEGRQDHDAVGRHEAAGDDRQGPEPRADHPVPGRAQRRRRRRAAPRHVGDGPQAARSGVTIILTTHYIEEAEEMADRIGVISKGEIILVEDKDVLMRKLGKKQLTLQLQSPLTAIPAKLSDYALELAADGHELVYTFDAQAEETGIAGLLRRLGEQGVDFKDLHTSQSSLEEIFVSLVRDAK